jgi:hypothetical protein
LSCCEKIVPNGSFVQALREEPTYFSPLPGPEHHREILNLNWRGFAGGRRKSQYFSNITGVPEYQDNNNNITRAYLLFDRNMIGIVDSL